MRYYFGISHSQDILIKQAYRKSLPQMVDSLELPFYFIMGKYDYMTSSASSKKYFDNIEKGAYYI